MGYVPQRKKYCLNFAGTEQDGLEVTLHGLSFAEFLEVQSLKGVAEGDGDDASQLLERFVGHLVSWNVTTETGVPVKPSMKSVSEMDIDFVLAIITAWLRAITGVSTPLESGSTSGQQSQEELISTETLSPSLAS